MSYLGLSNFPVLLNWDCNFDGKRRLITSAGWFHFQGPPRGFGKIWGTPWGIWGKFEALQRCFKNNYWPPPREIRTVRIKGNYLGNNFIRATKNPNRTSLSRMMPKTGFNLQDWLKPKHYRPRQLCRQFLINVKIQNIWTPEKKERIILPGHQYCYRPGKKDVLFKWKLK